MFSRQRLDYIALSNTMMRFVCVADVPVLRKCKPHAFTARRNARIASAVLAMAFPSVCQSVRLSHAGIVPKRRHVASCSLHCQIAKCVFCINQKVFSSDDPLSLKSWLKLTYPLLIAASL